MYYDYTASIYCLNKSIPYIFEVLAEFALCNVKKKRLDSNSSSNEKHQFLPSGKFYMFQFYFYEACGRKIRHRITIIWKKNCETVLSIYRKVYFPMIIGVFCMKKNNNNDNNFSTCTETVYIRTKYSSN